MKLKYSLIVLLFFAFPNTYGQTKFKIKAVETKNYKSIYYVVNEKGKTIKKLDPAKYIIAMTGDRYAYFAVFMIKGKNGWSAIDSNEKILFEVYNTSFGEPSPDGLVENKIRIVDKNNKIGYANAKGNIIIKPQFEAASSFYKGKAIIGTSCTKIPWGLHENDSDCEHYSLRCSKWGYINEKGTILKLGNYTLDEIQKKIKWKVTDQ